MENIIYFYEYRGNETQNILLDKVDFSGQQTGYRLIKVGIPRSFWSEKQKESDVRKEEPVKNQPMKNTPGENIFAENVLTENKHAENKAGEKRAEKYRLPQFVIFFHKFLAKKRNLHQMRSSVPNQPSEKIQESDKNKEQAKLIYRMVQDTLGAYADCKMEMEQYGASTFLKEDCRIVYENNIRPKLTTLTGWDQYFVAGEFKDFRNLFWVEQIMPYAVHADYQIIGYAPCIPRLLEKHARYIRSVCWVISEAVYTGQVQDFVENFYEEYGLAISIHLCQPMDSLRKVQITSDKPMNILDFSGEERMPFARIKQGSVWLDMDAMEEKARRIAIQNPQVSYVSLRKKWKNASNTGENARNCLDTACKSRYNT